ncbi:MAG: translation initiation factor IF-2 N-terminal domain-containing protein, partial [Candidatus Sulfotelmatobacter sp.]
MSKVRINDLARELEVKSKAILDALPLVGVTEKKTHSSSLEEHEAEKVRVHIRGSAEAQTSSARSARPLRGEEEIKTKIDLSHISRPGDVLKAITQKKEAAATPVRPAPVPPPPAVARPTIAPPAAKPPVAAQPPAAPSPVPAPAPRPPAVTVPVEKPAVSASAPASPVAAPQPPRPAVPPAAPMVASVPAAP